MTHTSPPVSDFDHSSDTLSFLGLSPAVSERPERNPAQRLAISSLRGGGVTLP